MAFPPIWVMNPQDLENLQNMPSDNLIKIIQALSEYNEKCEEARLEASASIDKITGRES